MFDSVHGQLVCSEPTRTVIRAGGLGYDVQVPLSTYETLPAPGEEVSLLVHLVVRETEWRLYGFASASERQVFRALLKVNGVGPAMALGLLSGLAPAEFRAAVIHGDVKALTRVKGIGKKTAERILVELRDVVVAGGTDEAAPLAVGASRVETDAVAALIALGLDAAEAQKRVDKHAVAADESVSDLVRRALRGG